MILFYEYRASFGWGAFFYYTLQSFSESYNSTIFINIDWKTFLDDYLFRNMYWKNQTLLQAVAFMIS